MKQTLLLLCLLPSLMLPAQIELQLTVEGATVETDCIDLFSDPDPLWAVDVAGQGNVVYPEQGGCYTAVPNLQYSATYACPDELPAEIEVCFSAFENDPILPIGCPVVPNCAEQLCLNFPVPAPGESVPYTLELPDNGDSRGTLNFTLSAITDQIFNNLPCDAVEMGLITRADTLGDLSQGIYSNVCADNLDEPNPDDTNANAFTNNHGVWFTFTTDSDIGDALYFESLSDPNNFGDGMEPEIAIYQADSCTGNLQLVTWSAPDFEADLRMRLRCPQPDTRYYVLVDGTSNAAGTEQGFFSLEITNADIDDAPDGPCDAIDLGAVPLGDTVSTGQAYSNFCATGNGDPFSPDFVTQTSVWFTFTAPPTGHVLIEGISDTELDPIGLQLSLYRPLSGGCTGFFLHEGSAYDGSDRDESLQLSCLFPGQQYYILVDGDGADSRGIFELRVSDAGDITPRTTLDTTICAGASLSVGSSVYTESGVYADTINVLQGCDSIVNTTLTVLEPIEIQLIQTQPAVGEGTANGQATISASGSAGSFTFEWCDGLTGPENNNLVGGEECCVTVNDAQGCTADTCFVVDFIIDIVPTVVVDSADCAGEASGSIRFSAVNGLPPYDYEWQNTPNTINGSGILNAENEEATLDNLPAGDYLITIADEFFDTTFVVNVPEPAPLQLTPLTQSDASCFGFCDGSLSVESSGGTPPYALAWSTGSEDPQISGLCAGSYTLTLTDANGCERTETYTIGQPTELIAEITVAQEIACFGGNDGSLQLTANEDLQTISWGNGESGTILDGLAAGTYSATVTNTTGCRDTVTFELQQPAGPVEAAVAETSPVSCSGFSDGVLSGSANGPGSSFSYAWSTGVNSPAISGLPAGDYQLTVTNERGCADTVAYTLQQPEPLQLTATAEGLSCQGGDKDGRIEVQSVSGGTPPYAFSLDGVVFQENSNFAGLFAGPYTLIVQDSRECETETTQVVDPAPEITVNAGMDTSIFLGDSIRLQAQVSGGTALQYLWRYQDGSGQEVSGEEIFVRPFVSTGYLVEVVDTVTLCQASDAVFIGVRQDRRIFVPNAFSPNGDGVNDWFLVFADDAVVEIESLRVFDRGGNMVFEREGLTPNVDMQGWDGLFRGEELNPGVFAWVAVIEFVDGRTEVFSGDVMLMR